MTTNKPAAAILYQAQGEQTEYLVRQPTGQVFKTERTALNTDQTLLPELWAEFQQQADKNT